MKFTLAVLALIFSFNSFSQLTTTDVRRTATWAGLDFTNDGHIYNILDVDGSMFFQKLRTQMALEEAGAFSLDYSTKVAITNMRGSILKSNTTADIGIGYGFYSNTGVLMGVALILGAVSNDIDGYNTPSDIVTGLKIYFSDGESQGSNLSVKMTGGDQVQTYDLRGRYCFTNQWAIEMKCHRFEHKVQDTNSDVIDQTVMNLSLLKRLGNVQIGLTGGMNATQGVETAINGYYGGIIRIDMRKD